MVQDSSVHPSGGAAESYPLSPLQEGMLFHRLDSTSPGVDLEQCICELHDEIDVACFERAWREVVARHAILRTGFVWQDHGAPRQVVSAAANVRVRFHHAEFSSENEARHGLEDYLASDRREGFKTLAAPLLRVALLCGGPRHHWWVVTFHHLLLDGRALVQLFKEVHAIHDAMMEGRLLELAPARPYCSYIDWLQKQDGAKAEKFWREQLAGFTTPTLLPIARNAAESLDDVEPRGELACRLTTGQTRELRARAAQHQVTMNTLIQAAWAIVLSRYTGEADVVFGAVRACRHIPVEDAGSIVGLFINTVPVRVRVPADAKVGAWLRELREVWVALREFEHTPLMKAQQFSEIPPGRALFDTLLNFQDPSWDTALRQLGGSWTNREFDIRSQPNYPLAVDAYGGDAILVKMLYDRRRFADDAIARLLGHFRVVLEAFASDTATVGELPMLTAHERHQLLETWQGAVLETPAAGGVHHLFERHAIRQPDAVAISDSNMTLTYAELNSRAENFAARLRLHGVGRETLVAVCMERSVEMIVAWLAALKAGGAFLPIDPKYPAERVAFMLEDSKAPVLLTQLSLRGKLPSHSAVVICLDSHESDVGRASRPTSDANLSGVKPDLQAGATPDHLAYVIYTSGSTGRPKGVEVEHRALLNLVAWHQHAFGVTSADRATQLASPAFDASVWEVWPYLAAGASLHLPDEETRISPTQLWQWLAAQRITIAFLPTPLAELALQEVPDAPLALRALLTGGDKLKRRPSAPLPFALINNYGPTENAVVSTSGEVPTAGDEPDAFAPTIGRPIANSQCYILDCALRPVPVGVSGELYVGGASLARGYLNRPELTAEKFIASPFASNARLYRTGDLARWTASGEIEFLGRLDGQVKVRGCRIELGEIEATLQSHPAVREALVLVRPDDRGEPQLAAFAISHGKLLPQHSTDVLDFLREKLPGYMVPAAVSVLDAWPLTANGKIDREALAAAAVARVELPAEDAAPAKPTTPTEAAVARVWSEILGHAAIGRHDNFFELGGHSLLAAQVVSRLNQALQSALTVRAVFDQPTVAGLAREVEIRRQPATDGSRPLAQRMKRRTARNDLEVLQPN